jgi:hypothetical protein
MRAGLLIFAFCGLLLAPMAAQVAAPQPQPDRTIPVSAEPGLTPPVNSGPLLSQLEQTAITANGDLSRLRIEKWKADRTSKEQATTTAESVQRNLTAALPGMIAAVRSDPDNLAAAFKLYRNLNALYDVMASLAESAGAFGPKEDYDALAADVSHLDQLRRQLADRVDTLANFKDAQVSRLMVQLRNQAAAAASAPPKKVIVDEEETPAKKPVRKKKAPAKPAQTKPQTPPAPSPTPPPK